MLQPQTDLFASKQLGAMLEHAQCADLSPLNRPSALEAVIVQIAS